jgi:hypothetical protein
MATIKDMSDVVNRLTGGSSGTPEHVFYHKAMRIAGGTTAMALPIAGRFTSLWQMNGKPSSGAVPTAVANPTLAFAGSLGQANPGGGRQKWLMGGMAAPQVTIHGVAFFDRLLHIGGLSGTNTGAQTVGGTLTRYTGAESAGNSIWVEIYTQVGAVTSSITASYTDQDGNSGATTSAVQIGNTGFREAQRLLYLPLATGDTGVQSVQSVSLTPSTGTAGNFGVNIMRQLIIFPSSIVGSVSIRDHLAGLPPPVEIKTDACIFGAVFANTASVNIETTAQLNFIEA